MLTSARKFCSDALSKIACRWLERHCVYPCPMTPREDVVELIQSLCPVQTEHDLIRMGPMADGGYLVPDDLDQVLACFSPGVSFESGFEVDCARRGMEVFLADYSVDSPPIDHSRFHFSKKFITSLTTDECMTLADWLNLSPAHSSNADLLLQMDIEGYEYEAFINIPAERLKDFRIIIVEAHNLHHLWSRPFFDIASRMFDKLLLNHTCVHIHPNNHNGCTRINQIDIPPIMEFTFLRNDRIRNRIYPIDFPHPLDRDNTSRPHLALPKCWQGDPASAVPPIGRRRIRKIM